MLSIWNKSHTFVRNVAPSADRLLFRANQKQSWNYIFCNCVLFYRAKKSKVTTRILHWLCWNNKAFDWFSQNKTFIVHCVLSCANIWIRTPLPSQWFRLRFFRKMLTPNFSDGDMCRRLSSQRYLCSSMSLKRKSMEGKPSFLPLIPSLGTMCRVIHRTTEAA